MAVAVPAPTQLEAQAGLAQPAAASGHPRTAAAVTWLATAAALSYGLSLVAQSALRSAEPGATLDSATRLVTVSPMALVVAVCVAVWLARRDDAGLLLSATLAPVLIALRGVSTLLLLSLELRTFAEVADVGIGLLVVGCLVWTATTSRTLATSGAPARSAEREFFGRVVDVTGLLIVAVALTGATVRAVGASWACQGVFPDCNGLGILPFGRDPLADIQLYHRLLAYAALALVLWLAIEAGRTQRHSPGVVRASGVLLGAVLSQAALGAASVSIGNPPLVQTLHLFGGAITVSAATVLVVLARRASLLPWKEPVHRRALLPPRDAMHSSPLGDLSQARSAPAGAARSRILVAYVQLTKPRVMSLLLATTATAMVIAARGLPDLGILVSTLIGGALMSGGAGAINHYVDRDIDPLMGRTAWRPIPSGVISPRRALWFGIGLAVLASAIFLAFVNVIACILALLGLLGYVFIYTLWLKRSTPSNIVIGGAAGAIPPLVGWAAVTNEISSLTAWYLFAIIFFWTPPHFWALSLLIRKHYERAGVPMLPVVRGEDETRRQIVLYSILLVVLTLVLSPFGMMGWWYFGAAILLGGLFIRGALLLWRRATPQAARSLYLYSLLYLFALFAAMAVDRVIAS
jgi:protoheme IX farnesyltransferase